MLDFIRSKEVMVILVLEKMFNNPLEDNWTTEDRVKFDLNFIKVDKVL